MTTSFPYSLDVREPPIEVTITISWSWKSALYHGDSAGWVIDDIVAHDDLGTEIPLLDVEYDRLSRSATPPSP